MNRDLTEKSKEISYALRHKPEEYNLKLNSNGSVPLDTLIASINSKHDCDYITEDDIRSILEQSDKKRFEISDGMIRAMYGHSCKTEISHSTGTPPDVLYHGTTHKAFESIDKTGLKPMNRQHVHLSESLETAIIVGKRRDSNPIVLEIDAKTMLSDGIKFYVGNDSVWLCDSVPRKYILKRK